MNQRWSRLSLNQKLAALALVLGFVAIFGTPHPGDLATVDTRALAVSVAGREDHVTPPELADWIIQGRADYRLLDVREADDYAAYHVPGAEHVPLTRLPDHDLGRNESIVLYSDGGTHAAQAWFLLRARGHRTVYLLLGGLDAWKDDVLFPILPETATAEETEQFAKAREVSTFFGGTPQTGGPADAAAEVVMPQVEMPTSIPVPTTRKKRREGC